ncbi:MAG: MotA/TolQ/ExbB proton channel family protein [Lentisphaerae bacterium]|nr:MotA/TolQ/ExbB proton channel family protein [Lentisphaerota bacterium]
MKKLVLLAGLALAFAVLMPVSNAAAQGAEGAAAAADAGTIVATDGAEPVAASNRGSGGFLHVVFGSGPLGVLLWLALFGAGGVGVYFVVDCAITVREKRIMPATLIQNVTESMAEGDVLKALQNCENEPGPLANVLTAGFSHVEEGFDVIQEAISTAADLETEKIMQKLTWISVVANIAPMLGLLGTVQGMIGAFSSLGQGAPDIGVLAMNIAQALYTTAAGLTVAVPSVTVYYTFRNSANKIVLRMEAMTMELIKDLRNVEVVDN